LGASGLPCRLSVPEVYHWDKLHHVAEKPFLSEVEKALSTFQKLVTFVLVIVLIIAAVWLAIGGFRYMWDHSPF
jgi:hypothetical protein